MFIGIMETIQLFPSILFYSCFFFFKLLLEAVLLERWDWNGSQSTWIRGRLFPGVEVMRVLLLSELPLWILSNLVFYKAVPSGDRVESLGNEAVRRTAPRLTSRRRQSLSLSVWKTGMVTFDSSCPCPAGMLGDVMADILVFPLALRSGILVPSSTVQDRHVPPGVLLQVPSRSSCRRIT